MTIYCHVILSFDNDDGDGDDDGDENVTSNSIIVGELVKDAVKRQVESLVAQKKEDAVVGTATGTTAATTATSPDRSSHDENDDGDDDEEEEEEEEMYYHIQDDGDCDGDDDEEEEKHDDEDDRQYFEDKNWIRQVSPPSFNDDDDVRNDGTTKTNHQNAVSQKNHRFQYVIRYSRTAFLQSLLMADEGDDGDHYDYAMKTTTFLAPSPPPRPPKADTIDTNDEPDGESSTTSTQYCGGQTMHLLDNRFWNRPLWAWTNVERQFVAGHLAATDLRKSFIESINERLNADEVSTLHDNSYRRKRLHDARMLVTNSDCPNHIQNFPWNKMACQPTIDGEPNVALLLVQEPDNDRTACNAETVSTLDPIVSTTEVGTSCSSGESLGGDEHVLKSIITPTKMVEGSDTKTDRPMDTNPIVTQSPSFLSEVDSNYPESHDVFPQNLTKKKPQIDSTGLDLTTLSELPPRIRSEIRAAQVLKERQQRKKRRRDSSFLGSWLSTFDPKQPKCRNNHKSRTIKRKTNGPQRQMLPSSSRREQKKSIVDFFGNKYN